MKYTIFYTSLLNQSVEAFRGNRKDIEGWYSPYALSDGDLLFDFLEHCESSKVSLGEDIRIGKTYLVVTGK